MPGLVDQTPDDDLFAFDPLKDYPKPEEPQAEPEQPKSPAPAASAASDEADDPFQSLGFEEVNFGKSSEDDALGFSFGSSEEPTFKATPEPAEPTMPAAMEETVVTSAPERDEAPIDLGLDDLLASTPSQQPATTNDLDGETVKLDVTSTSSDDQPFNLDLDLGGDDLNEEVTQPLSGPTEEFSIDLFPDDAGESETAPVGAKPEPIPLVSSSSQPARESSPQHKMSSIAMPGVVFDQDFEDIAVGARPAHWVGDEKQNVAFHVVENNGSKVLRYFKNAGTDSVHFYCRFPNVGGVVSVEFDACCPQKNKYLLGLYVERDGNYNQAVRTVIHCIDPAAASVRMQNEPVDYKLGEWVHVRYLIDLHQGVIDGFLDGEQVLAQQTFVNKPTSINTLSIRDNHATTGELLIDNIKIEKMA